MTAELAMSLADGCPECVRNVEPPKSAVAVDGGWRTAYLCADCGHAWTTDWAEKALTPQGFQRSFVGTLGENRDAPAGCVNTPARADRTALTERGSAGA